tara:strand:- start:700 stop:1788 length:1089 start_codon:yes stop_codon:yes gene_type:complete
MNRVNYICVFLSVTLMMIVFTSSSKPTTDVKSSTSNNQLSAPFSHSTILSSDRSFHSLLTLAHYRVFDSQGNPLTLHDLTAHIKNTDVTFLGETHTDVVAHYLEAILLEMTWDQSQTLSLEMFETDVQYVLDEYLAGLISEEHFIKSGRSWDNYGSDYRTMIEFSKKKGIPVLAANAPRRYVNMVRRLGEESLLSLSAGALRFLPPLPYATATQDYENKFRAIMSSYHSMVPKVSNTEEDINSEDEGPNNQLDKERITEDSGMDEETFQKMLGAQNLWDASMAWSIASHLNKHPQSRILHVNGNFHTDYKLGIPEHLKNYLPDVTMLVVTIVPSYEFPYFSDAMEGLGDFIIVTDANLPPSY